MKESKRKIIMWGIIGIVMLALIIAGENELLVKDPNMFIVFLLVISLALPVITVVLNFKKRS